MTMLVAALAMAAAMATAGGAQAADVADRTGNAFPVQLAQQGTKPKPESVATPKVAKPHAAKPHVAKPAAKPQAAKPAAKDNAAATERRIGEVTVVDAPSAPFLRLDGPWRERGYELRTWLTSYVYRDQDIRPPFHTLTVQVTHHDDAARNYGTARSATDDALDIAVATRPNQQCTKNRDNSRLCFYTEAYTVTVPEELLAAARAKGLTLRLGADARETLAVTVDAATVAAQIRAEEEVAKK